MYESSQVYLLKALSYLVSVLIYNDITWIIVGDNLTTSLLAIANKSGCNDHVIEVVSVKINQIY